MMIGIWVEDGGHLRHPDEGLIRLNEVGEEDMIRGRPLVLDAGLYLMTVVGELFKCVLADLVRLCDVCKT